MLLVLRSPLLPANDTNKSRRYIGIGAQGRSPKVIMLRTYLALFAAAQKLYQEEGGDRNPTNPVDPYMTLIGYFNSLRELGGCRRIVEDEVTSRLLGYGNRMRVGESKGSFVNRRINFEVVELTSREPTNKVSESKRRLALSFPDKERVDVAIATNMISVGLDIIRLGLMVVFGQPKTTAEYIQATSRVGRDDERPGLVVTLVNVHKPRDRSHYERFESYHATFYRSVEATSVTPFSPRAIDRGVAAVAVGLARQGYGAMTPSRTAISIAQHRPSLGFVADTIAKRGERHAILPPSEIDALRQKLRLRVNDLLDEWSSIAEKKSKVGSGLKYQEFEDGGDPHLLFDPLDPELANADWGYFEGQWRYGPKREELNRKRAAGAITHSEHKAGIQSLKSLILDKMLKDGRITELDVKHPSLSYPKGPKKPKLPMSVLRTVPQNHRPDTQEQELRTTLPAFILRP